MLKKIMRNLIALSSLLIPTSLALSCGNSVIPKNDVINFKYQDSTFSSERELIDYLLSNQLIESKYEAVDSDHENLHWKIDGTEKVFLNLKELDQYVAENYVETVTANIYLEGQEFLPDDDFLASIPLNSVVPVQYDKNGNVLGRAYVYRGIDDGFYFTTNPLEMNEMEENAKKSWMEMHNAYLFNGVYFANKEDLTYYLEIKYQSDASDPTKLADLRNYQIVMDSKNGKVAQTISIKPNKVPTDEELSDLERMVGYSVYNNSDLGLGIGENKDTFISFSDMEKDKVGPDNLNKLEDELQYWNIGTQDGESFYVVDNAKGSRGELFGSYFQKSPVDLGFTSNDNRYTEGISDYQNWVRNDSVGEADLSQAIDINGTMIGSLMSMAFSQLCKNYLISEETNINKGGIDLEVSMSELLEVAETQDYFLNNPIYSSDKSFVDYLNDLSNYGGLNEGLYPNLGYKMISMSQNLANGKRYNTFYLLPIARNYVISRLINSQISQYDLVNVNNAFIALADMASEAINNLLLPFNIKEQELLDSVGVSNGINLSKIYGFDNYHNSLYTNPQVNLDKAFGESGGKQGAFNKVQVSLANALLSETNSQLMQIAQAITSEYNQKIPINFNIDKKMTKKNKAGQTINTTLKDELHALIKAYFQDMPELNDFMINIVNQEMTKINNNFQDINPKIDQYNRLVNEYNRLPSGGQYYQTNYLTEEQKAKQKEIDEVKKDILEITLNKNVFTVSEKPNNSNIFFEKTDTILGLISKTGSMASTITGTEIAKNLAKVTGKIKYAIKALKVVKWIGFIGTGIDIILNLINIFIPRYNKVFYQYNLPNGNRILWNGGEEKTQFWKTTTTYGPERIQVINPIRLTVPHTSLNVNDGSGDASNYYLNGHFYDSPRQAFFEAMDFIKLNINSKSLDLLINSLFYNVELGYAYRFDIPNKSKDIYWKQNGTISDDVSTWDVSLKNIIYSIIYGKDENGEIRYFNGKNSPILNNKNGSWDLNLDSKYLETIWKTSGGYTTNTQKAIEEYLNDLLSTIKPVYIFQVPKTSITGEISTFNFELPYPYYSMSSGQIENQGKINSNAKYQFVYDPNIDENSEQKPLAQDQIIKKVHSEWAFMQFSVEQKVLSLDSVLGAKTFSELKELSITQNVYRATTPFNQIRYFWNLSAALSWLKSLDMLNSHVINEPNKIKIYFFISIETPDGGKPFQTIMALIEWLIEEKIIIREEIGGTNNA